MPDTQHETFAHQGLRVGDDDPQAMRMAVEMAFSYRGDVKITLRDGKEVIEGFVYDRIAADDPARALVRVMPRSDDRRVTVSYADIMAIEFTGRDTAAGRSFDTWMRKYVQKKLAGERAGIEAEPLE